MQRDTQFTCIDVLELHKIQIEKLMGGKKMKVKDCMCEDVCCVKPETKITEVAKLMSENHIGCIPVCDNNNCICVILTLSVNIPQIQLLLSHTGIHPM